MGTAAAAASGTDGRTASTAAAERTDGTTGEMIEGRINVMSAETGIGSETGRLGMAGKREMGEAGTCETEEKLPVEKMLKRVVMGRVETEFRRRRNDDEPSSFKNGESVYGEKGKNLKENHVYRNYNLLLLYFIQW